MRALFPGWRLRADKWASLTFYQRFESLTAFILTLVITLVILVALYRLIAEVLGALVFGAMNPLEYKVFQAVFGQIMTVLIALEFNHTLLSFRSWPSRASLSFWISKRRLPTNCWA